MRLTLLGTGAAGGMPLYGCDCVDCRRSQADPGLGRMPCSALLEWGEHRLLLDAGLPDLHRRFAPGSFDGMLLTHFHVDHVQGLFHLRWGRRHPYRYGARPISTAVPICSSIRAAWTFGRS
ncbi:hypothetical protein MBH78_03345 [Oceanimonas sp. NS1]|nr:hypothetical protein [Oceanimonas sp. NS1]